MRFVGRDRELKKLNELYQEEEFQFVVIYGRRRVGKTMLINEFLKKKRSAYYMAVEGTSKENLSSISKVLLAEKNEEFYMPEFPDFESLLSYIDHLCKNTDDQERLRLSEELAAHRDPIRQLALIFTPAPDSTADGSK